jgi:hypothetical protein
MKNEQKEEKIHVIGRRMSRKRKLECGEGGKTNEQ